ncbi:PspA/IM30 family protein [Coleofasciculus chthonoplastes]|uniref:PspA/IM30 family protein n=1 Tax=Coleofasciculus chthonoplastes TaxID=64178 RepID=UPI0032F89C07
MGLMERIGRVIHINLNRLIGKAENPEKILEQAVEDPEKILEQAIIDMQVDLLQLRQAVAIAIATQKRTEQQYNKYESEDNTWQQRAQIALQEGDENQAQEALQGKKAVAKMAQALQAQLAEQREIVTELKKDMRTLESKISDAKTKKDLYIARARSAQASEKINQMRGNLNTAFERMDRLQELEARSEAIAESSSRERIGRVIHINLNRLIGKAENPLLTCKKIWYNCAKPLIN